MHGILFQSIKVTFILRFIVQLNPFELTALKMASNFVVSKWKKNKFFNGNRNYSNCFIEQSHQGYSNRSHQIASVEARMVFVVFRARIWQILGAMLARSGRMQIDWRVLDSFQLDQTSDRNQWRLQLCIVPEFGATDVGGWAQSKWWPLDYNARETGWQWWSEPIMVGYIAACDWRAIVWLVIDLWCHFP